jgi:hypothetical protein
LPQTPLPEVPAPPKTVKYEYWQKRVKKIVFNQNKSTFILVWKTKKVEKEVVEGTVLDLGEKHVGFTVYDAQSLNVILDFGKN